MLQIKLEGKVIELSEAKVKTPKVEQVQSYWIPSKSTEERLLSPANKSLSKVVKGLSVMEIWVNVVVWPNTVLAIAVTPQFSILIDLADVCASNTPAGIEVGVSVKSLKTSSPFGSGTLCVCIETPVKKSVE